MINIGNHVSSSAGFLAMGNKALELGGDTFAFFTRNPRGGKAKDIDEQDVKSLLVLMKSHNFGVLVAHAPYTMNLCAAKPDIREFAENIFPSLHPFGRQPESFCPIQRDSKTETPIAQFEYGVHGLQHLRVLRNGNDRRPYHKTPPVIVPKDIIGHIIGCVYHHIRPSVKYFLRRIQAIFLLSEPDWMRLLPAKSGMWLTRPLPIEIPSAFRPFGPFPAF